MGFAVRAVLILWVGIVMGWTVALYRWQFHLRRWHSALQELQEITEYRRKELYKQLPLMSWSELEERWPQ